MSHASNVPRATYRLQFHRDFTLRDALALVTYLSALGVSHVYASPLLTARSGSTHGYDVCDVTRINPEVGTEADLEVLVAALREQGMGLVLDIVPNHMAVARENPWWWDVLRNGRGSAFADCFDIDWDSPDPDLRGRVLLPVLGDELERVLDRGELRLVCEAGEWMVAYFDHRYPVRPDTVPTPGEGMGAAPAGPDTDRLAMVRLLGQQHYQLAFWRHGDRRLNYRRFFTITDLAGVRVEVPEVFTQTHGRIIDWCRRGLVDGLRVDHPDGLRDPEEYLSRLRKAVPEAWIVIEKILETGEELPADWPVDGTTGYDYLARADKVFVDPRGEVPLTEFYAEFTGEPVDYGSIVREKKLWILRNPLAAEVARLVRLLEAIVGPRFRAPAAGPDELRDALVEFLACFPVYRTYLQAGSNRVSKTDDAWISHAFAGAMRADPPPSPRVLALLVDLLRGNLPGKLEGEFVMRFQQLTGPAMAKGVEDTTFYCFNRFVVLNEVGGDPAHFGTGTTEFHEACIRSQAQWPAAMLASTTHDTKRSEDVRARLAVLSEIPDQWSDAVRSWSAWNERHRSPGLPDRNAEYLFYQVLVGAWPLPVNRAQAYMEKASREAKQHTQWTDGNPAYDGALKCFIASVLQDREFTGRLERFLPSVIASGRINSLAQTLLKLTAPGVPDVYQGTELWDLSLVDPDNRRPVDYRGRRESLRALDQGFEVGAASQSAASFLEGTDDGRIKMWVIRRALQIRRSHEALYRTGDYLPLSAEGPQAGHVCAFARALPEATVITVVPRLVYGLAGVRDRIPVGCDVWNDTRLILPRVPAGCRFRNAFTGEVLTADAHGADASITMGEVLSVFPVALLERLDAPAPASAETLRNT